MLYSSCSLNSSSSSALFLLIVLVQVPQRIILCRARLVRMDASLCVGRIVSRKDRITMRSARKARSSCSASRRAREVLRATIGRQRARLTPRRDRSVGNAFGGHVRVAIFRCCTLRSASHTFMLMLHELVGCNLRSAEVNASLPCANACATPAHQHVSVVRST